MPTELEILARKEKIKQFINKQKKKNSVIKKCFIKSEEFNLVWKEYLDALNTGDTTEIEKLKLKHDSQKDELLKYSWKTWKILLKLYADCRLDRALAGKEIISYEYEEYFKSIIVPVFNEFMKDDQDKFLPFLKDNFSNLFVEIDRNKSFQERYKFTAFWFKDIHQKFIMRDIKKILVQLSNIETSIEEKDNKILKLNDKRIWFKKWRLSRINKDKRSDLKKYEKINLSFHSRLLAFYLNKTKYGCLQFSNRQDLQQNFIDFFEKLMLNEKHNFTLEQKQIFEDNIKILHHYLLWNGDVQTTNDIKITDNKVFFETAKKLNSSEAAVNDKVSLTSFEENKLADTINRTITFGEVVSSPQGSTLH